MLQLSLENAQSLKDWFLPERPGRLLGLHVITTGCGTCWVDRFPNPTAVLVENGSDYFLAGAPEAFGRAEIQRIAGWVDVADESVLRLLHKDDSQLLVDDRVVLELSTPPIVVTVGHYQIRPLCSEDTRHLERLSPELRWICQSWGGSSGLANNRRSWGAFDHDRLVSVASIYFAGDRYEEVGVVTEADSRGHGLSGACAAKVCEEVMRRGHRPSWVASSENTASLRVAHKLGFSTTGHVRMYGYGLDRPRSLFSPQAVRRIGQRIKTLGTWFH